MTAFAIIVGRLFQFAGILVLFGSSLFYLYAFRAGVPKWFSRPNRWPRSVLLVSVLTGIAGVMIWILAQTASISEQPSDAFNPIVVFGIMSETHFGRVCLVRIGLLAACLFLLWFLKFGPRLWMSLSLLSGGAVASFAWTGHGNKDDGLAGIVHLSGDLLHLFAAGVWLGALVPLALLIQHSRASEKPADGSATYDALESFSAIGAAVVAVLVLSGVINSFFLVGWTNIAALVTTTYGVALSIKLLLFGFMLLLAANNRYRLSPRLKQGLGHAMSREALDTLRHALLIETSLGVLVLAAVSFVGTLEPPISSAIGGGG
jgi:putative copper resistance protein D